MQAPNFRTLPGARPDWAYFLDVDGTLVDLAEAPGAIRVDDSLLALVAALHRACGGAVALVSGRTVDDLDARLRGLAIPLAGQHGLERRTAGGRRRIHGGAPPAARELRRHLESLLARHPGLLLEDKGLTLAVHYRQAPQLASYVHRLMREAATRFGEGLCLQSGKRVVEIKPRGADKGRAIEAFMGEPPFRGRFPVFIGDDRTDEHGFAMVNRLGGLSIKVGPGRTLARQRLPHVAAVRAWLAAAVPGYAPDPQELPTQP